MIDLEVTDETPGRAIPIEEVEPGLAVVQRFTFDEQALAHFSSLARDRAPIHTDRAQARAGGYEEPIVQGLALATRFSRLIGMYLPGERAVLETVELKYRRPVYARRELLYRVAVGRVFRPLQVIELALSISEAGAVHVSGRARTRIT